MRTEIAPITNIQRPVLAHRRFGNCAAGCGVAAAEAAGAVGRRPARLDRRAVVCLLGVAAAVAAAVPEGAAAGKPPLRGGAFEMLASRKPASASLICWICPSSCTVMLTC